MKSIRVLAKERMEGFCRVCPVCNGRACAGEVPGMGGIGTGASFRSNLDALAAYRFNIRLIHGAADPDPGTRILGKPLSIPVLAAPIGGVSFNMGGQISEEEYISSKLQACAAKGIIGCTGDGVPPVIHEAGFEAIRSVGGEGIPFIKPWEDDELFEKIEKALATGTDIIGMDIDAAGLVTLKLMGRPVSPKPLDQLRRIVEKVPAQFIVKGIMTADQARLAMDAGAAAIVVSNHGGRVLDHAPGAAEVLPEIAEAVNGRIAVLADGGVRSGGDVLKLVALGADAVMIGRPFSIATIGGLKEGGMTYIDQIRSELLSAMVLTGCQRLADATPDILRASYSRN